MRRLFLSALLLAGHAHAQNVATNPVFAVIPSAVPALDIDFTTGTLDSRVVFSRASSRSCVNSIGTIVTVASNNPCLDFDPVTLASRGLSVEATGTNSALQSATNNAASWPLSNAGGATSVATYNNAVAPDGTSTATRMAMSAVTVNFSVLNQGIATGAGQVTISIWLKGAVGGETTYLHATPNGTTYYRNFVTLTTSWVRYSVSFPATAATWFYQLGTDLRDAGQSATPAETFYAWGAQFEAGYAPTSYIPTTAASVVRAAEFAYVGISGLKGINGNTGSLFAQMIYEAPNPATGYDSWLAIYDSSQPTAGSAWGFSDASAGTTTFSTAISGIGASSAIGSPAWGAGKQMRGALTFSSQNLNGAVNVSGTTAGFTTLSNMANTLRTADRIGFAAVLHFQSGASIWFQRATYYPAYLGPNWATNKASGAIP